MDILENLRTEGAKVAIISQRTGGALRVLGVLMLKGRRTVDVRGALLLGVPSSSCGLSCMVTGALPTSPGLKVTATLGM